MDLSVLVKTGAMLLASCSGAGLAWMIVREVLKFHRNYLFFLLILK